MHSYPFDRALGNTTELLNFYSDAIHYRNSHKAQSSEIAQYVFNATHPTIRLTFPVDTGLDRLRDEFGALEAPGMPMDDTVDPDEDEDRLWERLLTIVKNEQDKRTV